MAWRKGFVAHIRFDNRRDDADLSANNRYAMDVAIDRYVQSKGIET
jgi:hypothetical protein